MYCFSTFSQWFSTLIFKLAYLNYKEIWYTNADLFINHLEKNLQMSVIKSILSDADVM